MIERLTEKRNSQNTIPLKNAVCGIDMPYWALCNQGSVTDMYLAGDAADRLAAYEDTGLTPEEIEETISRFELFLMEMTGGRMSKSNYTLDAMISVANDHQQNNEHVQREEAQP